MTQKINLTYGQRRFQVDIEVNCRKHLTITVHPDCTITAIAPVGYEIGVIKKRLERRKSWIAKQVSFFEQFQPEATPHLYLSGETHYYLGRQYRLKIRRGSIPRVRLVGQFFQMELSQPDDRGAAKALMQDWYVGHAKVYLSKRFEHYWPVVHQTGVTKPEIKFRRLKKRWGNYSNGGTITLNTELVKLPANSIDYVIVHELCHVIYLNHESNFYRLLGRILPDWEERKNRLEKTASAVVAT